MNLGFDINALSTPYYVVDETLLTRNLEILRRVADESGCKILLAQKAFSMFSLYPLVSRYLDGTTASGLFEAKLGYEEFGGETHVFSVAFTDSEFESVLGMCSHVVLNSFAQWEKLKGKATDSEVKSGIRINPELSTQDHAIYDPAPGSRLGVTLKNFRRISDGISGFHFHTSEQNPDALIATIAGRRSLVNTSVMED